jgi:hypothetical protein
MPPLTKHRERPAEDGFGSGPGDDQLSAEPPHNRIARIQSQTNGYIARHPTLVRVLQWLGWNNPGASMNP